MMEWAVRSAPNDWRVRLLRHVLKWLKPKESESEQIQRMDDSITEYLDQQGVKIIGYIHD